MLLVLVGGFASRGGTVALVVVGLAGVVAPDADPLQHPAAELADLVAERLAQARTEVGSAQLEPGRISAAVTAAVTELRERPDVPAAELESEPGPDGYPVEMWRTLAAQGREAHQDHLHIKRELGLLALQAVPGYVAERDAEEVLHVLGEEIGSSAEELLACRRYALTGDARATERFCPQVRPGTVVSSRRRGETLSPGK
ncbi:hypothetical protein ACWCXH_34320 [Kitasatospora sp. NPDC001660]